MSELSLEHLEGRIQETARLFAYPPTPEIAAAVRRRLEAPPPRQVSRRQRMAWAIAILVFAMAGLLAVPPVRAQILEFLQFGAVRIFFTAPTPTATPTLIPTTQSFGQPQATASPIQTPVPVPTATLLPSLLNLAGETSLQDAHARLDFPILLPSYPPDLGPPDYVFLQDQSGEVLILVWIDPDNPDQVLLSLHEFGQGTFAAEKWEPRVIENTLVNGRPALWASGPYLMVLRNGDLEMRRLIQGQVLIWVVDDITYRLETDLEMEEAVRIAESLRPLP